MCQFENVKMNRGSTLKIKAKIKKTGNWLVYYSSFKIIYHSPFLIRHSVKIIYFAS